MKRDVPLVMAMLLTSAACGGSSSSPTLPPTTPALTTETFTGSVDVASSDSHNFNVTQAGSVNVTLTAAGPPPTIFMGLGIGTPSGSTCAFLSGGTTITPAGTTPQLSGTLSAGTYCVEVLDVGNQSAAITYTVTVAHP